MTTGPTTPTTPTTPAAVRPSAEGRPDPLTAPAPGAAAVETEHLTRRFRGDQLAVDDVSLRIEADAIVGLLGRNGAGKTTLMSLLTAQDRATAGSVRLFGQDPSENDEVLARTCFIRESQRYPNNFRVGHVLASGAAFYPHWDADLAEQLVDEFRLPHRRQVQRLSRGMRGAVGIVVGLASRAPLTVFDEPTLGLDATSRQRFYDLLLREYAEQPRTVVLSTHLIDEVAPLLEQVHVLDEGRLTLSGDVDELRTRACLLTGPADWVASVIGDRTVLHREPLGGYERVTVAGGPAEVRAEAQRAGVDVGPVSLQTLVVQAGRHDSHPADEGTR